MAVDTISINWRGYRAEVSAIGKLKSWLSTSPAVESWFDDFSPIKQDPFSTVAFCQPEGCDVLCVKQYRRKGLIHGIKERLGLGRVANVWRVSRKMRDAGLPVPQPVAYVCQSDGRAAYYFSEKLDGIDLHTLSKTEDMQPLFDQYQLCVGVAELLARIHCSGFVHGDTKWGNIILNRQSGKISVIDLDAAAESKSVKRRARDLARFMVNCQAVLNSNDEQLQSFVDYYQSTFGKQAKAVIEVLPPVFEKLSRRQREKYS